MLDVSGIDPGGVVANALSIPPGEYGRKAKTQRNWRGPAQAVEHVVQFDYAKNLTWVGTLQKSAEMWMCSQENWMSRCCMAVVSSCREMLG